MTERAPEYAVMLCFDVEVEKEAEQMAEEMGLKVFKGRHREGLLYLTWY